MGVHGLMYALEEEILPKSGLIKNGRITSHGKKLVRRYLQVSGKEIKSINKDGLLTLQLMFLETLEGGYEVPTLPGVVTLFHLEKQLQIGDESYPYISIDGIPKLASPAGGIAYYGYQFPFDAIRSSLVQMHLTYIKMCEFDETFEVMSRTLRQELNTILCSDVKRMQVIINDLQEEDSKGDTNAD